MLPEGLIYLNSWLEKDGDRCFQLMETDDPSLFTVWTARWKDLVSFEVIEISEKPDEGDVARRIGSLAGSVQGQGPTCGIAVDGGSGAEID